MHPNTADDPNPTNVVPTSTRTPLPPITRSPLLTTQGWLPVLKPEVERGFPLHRPPHVPRDEAPTG